MKPIFLFALLFAAGALRAQSTFPILNDLEGTWYQEGRQLATYSDWQFTDDQTLVNRVYSVKCKVTTELSYAVLHFENASATLSYWADSLHSGTAQVFRLLQIDADELVFQNENAGGQPQQLAWSFSRHGNLVARTDLTEINFDRRGKLVLPTKLMLSLGANMSTLANHRQPQDQRYFHPSVGADLSIALNIHGKGPLGFNLEMGLSQQKFEVAANWTDRDVYYSQTGVYRNIDFSAAFIPELWLGKHHRFILCAGISSVIVRKSDFRGENDIWHTNPNQKEIGQSFYLGHEGTIVGGLTWQLPKIILPTLQPVLYCRGTWGLGYTKVRAISVGIGVRLK